VRLTFDEVTHSHPALAFINQQIGDLCLIGACCLKRFVPSDSLQ
jgi:hypothetical protein